MSAEMTALVNRVNLLEHRLRRRNQVTLLVLIVAAAITMATSHATSEKSSAVDIIDEVRTRKLVVVDDRDRVRITIDQDGPEIDRYSRSAGLTIYDDKGHERGGIATMDDGSAVIALDSPWGVGSPMRDRAGMKVNADGSAMMGLISNLGSYAAVLHSDGRSGSLELYQAKEDGSALDVKTFSFSGDSRTEMPLSEEQKSTAE